MILLALFFQLKRMENRKIRKIIDKNLDLDLHEDLVDAETASELFDLLEDLFPLKPNKRVNQTYGDDGLVYEIKFQNGTVKRKAQPWKPVILVLKELVEKVTGEKFTICVVQRYPNGKIGIQKHRDKEMKHGTKIAGLSIGQQRKLIMARNDKEHIIELPSGSLYVMNPPTNDFWTHCIPRDSTNDGVRISLTFRNY